MLFLAFALMCSAQETSPARRQEGTKLPTTSSPLLVFTCFCFYKLGLLMSKPSFCYNCLSSYKCLQNYSKNFEIQ